MTSTVKAEPLGSTVSSLSEAPLYEAAKKAHEERRAVFQAALERATESPGSESSGDVCLCGHAQASHDWHAARGETCIGNRDLCSCRMFHCAEPGAEPPLTPEEEEELDDEPATCKTCDREWEGKGHECTPTKPAPPARRPPYAVAYSVGGQLYEVALPGDATVTAVDGALVIKHSFGQVAGIVGIQPIEHKEAS